MKIFASCDGEERNQFVNRKEKQKVQSAVKTIFYRENPNFSLSVSFSPPGE